MLLRLSKIDELTRGDHYYLEVTDQCYFLREYTARRGFSHSETNQLIINLKKPVDRRNNGIEWRHKENAIKQVASELHDSLEGSSCLTGGATFVPIPPSKTECDPLYDDRMLRVLQTMTAGERKADVREMVKLHTSMPAAHANARRPDPKEVSQNYTIVEKLCSPSPGLLIVVDDVLTTGSHFKAMQLILSGRFPQVPVVGLFVARRDPQSDDFVS